MKARHLTGFLHGLLEPRHHHAPSFRVAGPELAGRAFHGRAPRELTVVAHSSSSSLAAERLRLALLDGAARTDLDDWALTAPVSALELPVALTGVPATMLGWTTRNMDREQQWVAAYLRRGRVTWEVLAMGDSDLALDPIVARVAVDLIDREPHSLDSSLWDLLPGTLDLPVPMCLIATLGADSLADLAEVA